MAERFVQDGLQSAKSGARSLFSGHFSGLLNDLNQHAVLGHSGKRRHD
jgi:hypothetical protein